MKKLIVVPFALFAVAAPQASAATAEQARAVNPADGTPTVAATEGPDPIHARGALSTKRPNRPVGVKVPSHLQAIAACESGGDPKAIGGGGLYRGKYQFSIETWQAVGGQGDPVNAPEPTQDRMAIKLYETSGPGQWPVCSQ